MLESAILKTVHLKASQMFAKVFRQNVGLAWVGQLEKVTQPKSVVVVPGDVILRKARPLHSGIEGMSDLIGWRSIVVTPEMVGHKIAVYTAIETKTITGRLSSKQKNFIDNVNEDGGNAFVARSEDDVVFGFSKRFPPYRRT